MRPQNLFEKIINFLKRLFSTEKQRKKKSDKYKRDICFYNAKSGACDGINCLTCIWYVEGKSDE